MCCRDNFQLQDDRRQLLAGNLDALPPATAPPPLALPIGWDAAGAGAGDGDRRDEIDNVAQRMRDRKKGKPSDDDDEIDSEGSGSDEASVSPPPKRKKDSATPPPKGKNGKTGKKGKKGQKDKKVKKGKNKGSASPPPKAKLGSWPNPPTIGWEKSRFQALCRTCQGGAGSSLRIPFEGNGGSKGAWAKAKAWLHDKKQEYKKHRA
jgi:hypothetical protein